MWQKKKRTTGLPQNSQFLNCEWHDQESENRIHRKGEIANYTCNKGTVSRIYKNTYN